MDERYDPATIESAAQSYWEAGHCFEAREDARRRKYYACSMLPYPSGKLHMGHVRNYTINDMMARQLRMKGYNVLMPMGWDAFGLPAENAAINNKVPPAKWTYDNIAVMKKQMQSMGLAIDWSREIAACDPRYYRWNQWLFLKMLEKGIAYRKTQIVNWDPIDKTVLANEQVVDGKGWRTGAPVEKREIPGYYLKITDYAEELLKHVVDDLQGWPDRVRAMQENWIGKSTGVRFAFPHEIRDASGAPIQAGKLWVFTTRADTIMGVTFVAVAPEHPLAAHAAQSDPRVAAFIETAKKGGTSEAELALKDKEGVPTGLFVSHPLSGEKVQIWVGNYVLMTYGDGAVMGVPAHDERDFAFAKKYGLPIKQVVDSGKPYAAAAWQEWYADKQNGVCVNSGVLDGLAYRDAASKVAEILAAQGLGEKKTTWRLRDWGISRQRYWGTPIPIIHCQDCGPVPVPYKDLPVVLPEDLVPDGSGNPLEKDARFLAVHCPQCNKPARRETDTMDTFVDSAWYYMRYCSPDSAEAMVDARIDYWIPMDQYIGGIEHAVLHLLYARFWTKVMRDMGLVKFGEPFTNLLCQGMVLKDGSKMSKSKGNTVDPQEIIGRYGADTARLFIMFASPPEQTLEWNDAAVEGSHRFLRRVWQFGAAHEQSFKSLAGQGGELSSAARALRREIHLNLRQADNDYTRLQYNTVVSAGMKMLNALESAKLTGAADTAVLHEGFSILLRVLYPATPHIAHVLWGELGYAKQHGEIIDAPWPTVDETALIQDEIELVVQVNGKHRGNIRVPAQAERAAIEAAALADERVSKFIIGTPKKVIVVPGKLVNVVV